MCLKDGREVATDPNAAWYDFKKKAFYVSGRTDRMTQLADALAWVKEKYGKDDFVRNRMGDYVEREINTQFPIPERTDPCHALS